jgi:hypothetical protein
MPSIDEGVIPQICRVIIHKIKHKFDAHKYISEQVTEDYISDLSSYPMVTCNR